MSYKVLLRLKKPNGLRNLFPKSPSIAFFNRRNKSIEVQRTPREKRYFTNPFPDFPDNASIGDIKNLITKYVADIVQNCISDDLEVKDDGSKDMDLYSGKAGIAYLFWRLSRSIFASDFYSPLGLADRFITYAKNKLAKYPENQLDQFAFLCGNAGIHAVAAAIHYDVGNRAKFVADLESFRSGIAIAADDTLGRFVWNEMLVGRAGYLTGCYWLNDVFDKKLITDDEILAICKVIIKNGREYARFAKAPFPLMFHYHGTEYLGAAHGLSGILHMLLNSPWFQVDTVHNDEEAVRDIKQTVDLFLDLQDSEGNFPVDLNSFRKGEINELVHWCHGAPGIAHMLGRAFFVFGEQKYLIALRRCADLIWKKGFLRKGPGLCHGVAGNGYVFLLTYRLTNEPKYFYRAVKYLELLSVSDFMPRADIPDRPHSLFEGCAGTACYLIDMLEPHHAIFPFMRMFR